MKHYAVPHTDLQVSRIAYGCMHLGRWNHKPLTGQERRAAVDVIRTAFDVGINLFDHADIYAYGKSEEAFAAIWDEIPRDRVVLQSKCGIIMADDPRFEGPGRYDFSYEHILQSVEGILRRLQTDYLDVLLLHRPDPLMEPEEVARAFDELQQSGRVRAFGVSNHGVAQMELLQAYVDQPLVINQLELSLLHNYLVDDGVQVNVAGGPVARTGGLLEWCRRNDVLVQAWSPVAGGRLFDPPDDAEPRAKAAGELLARMALEKNTTAEAVALAWILRHPAGIQPIIGTTRPERVRASVQADELRLSRTEWYDLFTAARGGPVP